jgi:hypothetical protein
MFLLEMFAELFNLRPKILYIKITTDSAIGMERTLAYTVSVD